MLNIFFIFFISYLKMGNEISKKEIPKINKEKEILDAVQRTKDLKPRLEKLKTKKTNSLTLYGNFNSNVYGYPNYYDTDLLMSYKQEFKESGYNLEWITMETKQPWGINKELSCIINEEYVFTCSQL